MESRSLLVTPVLLTRCLIINDSFGIRCSFGLFQITIAEDLNWLHTNFSLTLLVQNLGWGMGQQIFYAIIDRIGDKKIIFGGALLYIIGLVFSANSTLPIEH